MKTKQIFIDRRNPKCGYFRSVCTDFRAMENTALFYYRNTISGLRKSPERRYPHEMEVLRNVFAGITEYNWKKTLEFDAFVKATGNRLARGEISGSMARAFVCVMYSGDPGGGPRKKPAGCKDESWKRPCRMKLPTRSSPYLSYEQMDAVFKMMDNHVYRRMHSQVNQNAIKKMFASVHSFYAGSKGFANGGTGYTGKPHFPHYIRDVETTAWFTNQTAALKKVKRKDVLSFVNSNVVVSIGKLDGKYVKTEVKPHYGGYLILVTYDDSAREIPVPEHPDRLMGVDVGMNNLAAVANNLGYMPFVIRGGAVKAKNQWFNKRRAELISTLTRGLDSTRSVKNSKALDALSRERDAYLRDFFYKAAHYICRAASAIGVQVIVAGHNKGQKDEINLGHVTNQAFVSIPFTKFLLILRFTAWQYGIAFVSREESYTSQASLLDLDDIPTYGENPDMEGKYTFSGKRRYRGLYVAKDGTLINADINGAGNILRKEFPYAFDGKDMSFLAGSTLAVSYADLYRTCSPYTWQAKHAAKKEHMHRQTVGGRTRKYARWDRKIGFMAVFDAGKKIHRPPEKKAA